MASNSLTSSRNVYEQKGVKDQELTLEERHTSHLNKSWFCASVESKLSLFCSSLLAVLHTEET